MLCKKKVLCFLLGATMLLSMAACAQAPQQTAPDTTPTSAPTTAPTAVPTTAPTTAPTTVPITEPTTAPTTAPTVNVDTLVQPYISEADALIAAGDYAQALEKVTAALAQYPDSSLLQSKLTEINSALAQQAKEKLLQDAEALAAAGNYQGAMALLKDALDSGEDADYREAYNKYEHAYAITVTPSLQNPNQNPESIKAPKFLTIIGGSSKHTALAVQRQDIHTSTFSTQREMWYTFTTSSNYSVYQIALWNKDIPCNVYFRIYDDIAAAKEISTTIAAKGEQPNSFLELTPNTQYWIKVTLSSTSYKGSYQFSVNEILCDAGANADHAFYIDLNRESQKFLDKVAFYDWLKFRTGEGTAYQLSLTNVSLSDRIYVEVYDSSNKKLASGNGLYETITLDLQLESKQEYYIVVRHNNDATSGAYKLTVSEK